MRNTLAVVVLLLCFSLALGPAVPPPVRGPLEVGVASWYGDPFHGRLTANGEIYDMHQFTAAHPNLPFGSTVRVTNIESGRSVVVRINDRGPYLGGRILDLSYAAAQHLRLVWPGAGQVRLDEIAEPIARALRYPSWPPPDKSSEAPAKPLIAHAD